MWQVGEELKKRRIKIGKEKGDSLYMEEAEEAYQQWGCFRR